MPKGEFQNRDRDETPGLGNIPLAGSLGELPPDLATERGDLQAYDVKSFGSDFPDMRHASINARDARETGIGSPLLDFTVRSTFDSRPTSARDFNEWFQVEAPVTANPFQRSYIIPAGYVGVLREVRFLFSNIVYTQPYLVAARLCLNGAVVSPEQGVDAPSGALLQNGIGVESGTVVKTFLIADENQTFGVLFDNSIFAFPNVISSVGFYGNLLLKTGVPAMFQIANFAGRTKSAVTSSIEQIEGRPTHSGVTLRRRRKNIFPNVPILRGK